MGSRGRPLFDLNETPVDEDEDISIQPQKVCTSLSTRPPGLFVAPVGKPNIASNNSFSHASSVSGFQPFVRSSISSSSDRYFDLTNGKEQNSGKIEDISDRKELQLIGSSTLKIQTMEKEEGEWSDGECSDPHVKDHKHGSSVGLDLVPKQKEVKSLDNPGKRKLDEQKEAMLGKKRLRKTVFINIEDAKQAATAKSSTPRINSVLAPNTTRTIKGSRNIRLSTERNGENHNDTTIKDSNQVDVSCNEERSSLECVDRKSECNSDMNAGHLARPRRLNSSKDMSLEENLKPSSWKHPCDLRQVRKPAVNSYGSVDIKPANKKNPPPKRQNVTSNMYQDTSVERLLREVTSEKFWHNPEESELQCVPGRFESVEDYIRVFEPLLFEECRAQLYSTWEELTETSSREAHVMVRIKSVERRKRGWYDVIVLAANEMKWSFKEGDVAVLSTPRPTSVRYRRSNKPAVEDIEEHEENANVVGTVRRHIPLDVRDPHGATLHFFVGDSYDPNNYSTADNCHVLKKLLPRSIWFLSVLGTLATTQREYVALHAFHRLNLQVMGNANALVQSDDWKALIGDAKARNCYMDMDSLPKEFLVPKAPAYDFAPSKFTSGARGLRAGGPRSRLFDMPTGPKPRTLVEEDKPKHFSYLKD